MVVGGGAESVCGWLLVGGKARCLAAPRHTPAGTNLVEEMLYSLAAPSLLGEITAISKLEGRVVVVWGVGWGGDMDGCEVVCTQLLHTHSTGKHCLSPLLSQRTQKSRWNTRR